MASRERGDRHPVRRRRRRRTGARPHPCRRSLADLTRVGDIYCAARLSGDMAPILAILTPELVALIARQVPEGADPAIAIPLAKQRGYDNTCMPVGASGTAAAPDIMIAFGYRDPDKAQYADKLVLRFVDQRLRVDDVACATGSTRLEKLGTPR